MENRKVFVSLLKRMMKPIMSQHRFSFIKPTTMARINKDTLHIINFDVHTPGFNCDVAIQPLYVPKDSIALDFGDRINYFKVELEGIWGYGDSHQDEQELIEVIKLLENNVLPWFDEVGSPEGIIRFLKDGWETESEVRLRLTPSLRYLYQGFSYMYLSELRLGSVELEHYIKELQNDSRPWVNESKKMAENMISLCNEGDEEKVKQQLAKYREYTRGNLKIKV